MWFLPEGWDLVDGMCKAESGQGRAATGTRVELQLTWSQWKHSFLTLIFIASEIVSLLMKVS